MTAQSAFCFRWKIETTSTEQLLTSAFKTIPSSIQYEYRPVCITFTINIQPDNMTRFIRIVWASCTCIHRRVIIIHMWNSLEKPKVNCHSRCKYREIKQIISLLVNVSAEERIAKSNWKHTTQRQLRSPAGYTDKLSWFYYTIIKFSVSPVK